MALVTVAERDRKRVRNRVRIVTVLGLLLTIVGLLLGLGMPWLVRTVIKSQMYISKGFSPIRYALEFSNGQLPEHIGVYIKFCIFSIQNPREFSAGARARLREMGPYVYRLRGQIKIMDWGPNDETVFLSLRSQFNYVPELSVGSPNDTITIVNLPIYVMGAIVRNFLRRFPMSTLSVPVAVGALNFITLTHNEGLIKRITVRQLFEGYPFSLLETLDVFAQPLKWFGIQLPDIYYKLDQKFGLFHVVNNTVIEPIEVETGLHDTSIFRPAFRSMSQNVVIDFSFKLIKFFNDPNCRIFQAMNGLSIPGHTFGPGADKSDKIYAFEGNICSIKYAKYLSYALSRYVPVWRFIMPRDMMSAPEKNRNNKCLCTTPYNPELCQGMVDLGPCTFGAPISLTYPHFLHASHKIRQTVFGLEPIADKHQPYLDVHPTLGLPINAMVRLQVNLLIEPLSQLVGFGDLSEAILPFLWFEPEIHFDGVMAYLPALGLYPLMALDYGAFGIMFMGLALIVLARLYAHNKRNILSSPSAPPQPVRPVQRSPELINSNVRNIDNNNNINNNNNIYPITTISDKVLPFSSEKSAKITDDTDAVSADQWSRPPAYSSPSEKYYVKRAHFGTQTSPLNVGRRLTSADRKREVQSPPGSIQ